MSSKFSLRTKAIIFLGVIALWHASYFELSNDELKSKTLRGESLGHQNRANNPVTKNPDLEARTEREKDVVETGASLFLTEEAVMAVNENVPPSSEKSLETLSDDESEENSGDELEETSEETSEDEPESEETLEETSEDESEKKSEKKSEDELEGNDRPEAGTPNPSSEISTETSTETSITSTDSRSSDEGGNETSAIDDSDLSFDNETITELLSLVNPVAEPMNVAINLGSSASANENSTDLAVDIGGSIASNSTNTSVIDKSEATDATNVTETEDISPEDGTFTASNTNDTSTIETSEATAAPNVTETDGISPDEGSSSSANITSTGLESNIGVPTATYTNDTNAIETSEASDTLNKTETEDFSSEDGSSVSASDNSTGLAIDVGIPVTSNTTNTTSEAIDATNKTETDDLALKAHQYALWKATRDEFEATVLWKNESTFTTVSRDVYQQLVQKAHASVESVVKDVFTDCELHIVPGMQTDDEENKSWGGKPKPKIQFMCFGDKDPILQDNPCHTVNMCRVVLDENTWKENMSNFTFNTTSTNSRIDSSIDHAKKSTLLMMVDSIEYMTETKLFKATINKASYAYRSNRPLYIWIGNLNQEELNRREVASLEPAFGFKCASKELSNSNHYYKPVALLVLLDILSSSSASGESIFLLDADADFSPGAFDRIDGVKINDQSSEGVDPVEPMGPESYLDLSPQASLMAIQNTKGKMLMNSGLMILRNTKWSKDFSALWWYGRCGGKDQLSLWLVLYATFSAWTTIAAGDGPSAGTELEAEDPIQFAYPGQIFYEYNTASNKLFMHFRKYGYRLQGAWEAVSRQRQKVQSSNSIETEDKDNYDYPIPTNTKLYNGGYPDGIQQKFLAAMELPHVLILPLRSVSYNKTIDDTTRNGTISTVEKLLPVLKSEDGNSFVTHSKSLHSCTDGRCWPYVIE